MGMCDGQVQGGEDELGDEKTGGDVNVRLTQAGFII